MREGQGRDGEEYEGSPAGPWPRLATTVRPGREDSKEGVVYNVKVTIRGGVLS